MTRVRKGAAGGAGIDEKETIGFREQMMNRLGGIPDYSRDVAGRVDTHVRENPWLHIGLIGVSSLALGYFIGRSISGDAFGDFKGRFFASDDTEVRGVGDTYED